jgi:hypothetical protein
MQQEVTTKHTKDTKRIPALPGRLLQSPLLRATTAGATSPGNFFISCVSCVSWLTPID